MDIEDFIDSVKNYRETFPNKIIIAGNVATREMTEALILAGARYCKNWNRSRFCMY